MKRACLFLIFSMPIITSCEGAPMPDSNCQSLLQPEVTNSMDPQLASATEAALAKLDTSCLGSGYFELVKAQLALTRGDSPEARKWIEAGRKVRSIDHLPFYQIEAQLNDRAGRGSDNRAIAEDLIKSRPDDGLGYFLLGRYLGISGDVIGAIRNFELGARKGSPAVQFGANKALISAYWAHRDIPDAARSFDSATALNEQLISKDSELMTIGAVSHLLSGDPAGSMKILKHLLAIHPDSAADKSVKQLIDDLKTSGYPLK